MKLAKLRSRIDRTDNVDRNIVKAQQAENHICILQLKNVLHKLKSQRTLYNVYNNVVLGHVICGREQQKTKTKLNLFIT